MAEPKKLGREISFRKANGITRTARVGTALYNKFDKIAIWHRVTRTIQEREETYTEVIDLTTIKGVGEGTAEKLVKAGYMSIKAVAEASAEDIAKKLDISENAAIKIQKGAVECAEAPTS
jgi:ERCC4-type nuclease